MFTITKKKIGSGVLLFFIGFIISSPSESQPNYFCFPHCGNLVLQVGAFDAYQGRKQNVGIQGLIGDRFTVTHHHDQNMILGVGYYLLGFEKNFKLLYGLNAFYLAQTDVRGNIVQEQRFTNLAYRYQLINCPIYLAAKALVNLNTCPLDISLDVGIGPNIIYSKNFSEYSLDGGITIPDRAFSGNTAVDFSATLGIGIYFKNLFGNMPPIEMGYRFFYLGNGNLAKNNNQLTAALHTGDSFANALLLSVSI